MRKGDAFARVVGVVTRRPLLVLSITALLALGGAVLALRLEPSAATDTLVDRDSESFQATDEPPGSPRPLHYLRTTNPLNAENLAAYPTRLPTNRSNPYVEPGGYLKLAREKHLDVFGSYLCTSGALPQPPAPVSGLLPPTLVSLINQFAFAGTGQAGIAPPCDPQAPLGQRIGQTGVYPQLQDLPPENP